MVLIPTFVVAVESLGCVWLFATLWTAAHQASLYSTLKVCSNSYPLSQWCCLTISTSATPFSYCLQSFPASGSFLMNRFFPLGDHFGWSFNTSISPSNEHSSPSPLGWTGWTSLQSKGLSRVFSNTTVQKHRFLVISLLYSPTLTSIHDYWKNHSLD